MKEQTPLMTLSGPWWVRHVCMRTSSGALTLRWWSFGKLIICAYWAQSLSLVQHFATIWTVAHQALLSMGFPRQEYWIGLPFPSPGDLPDPGIKPESSVFPAFQPHSLPSESLGKPQLAVWSGNNLSLDLSSQKPSFQGVLILNVVQTCSILHINTQSHIKSSSTTFPWQAFSQLAFLNFPGFPLNLCTLCKPCTALTCGLKSFWPPCSMPVLQVIFCSRITAYQLHTSQTSKLLCPPVSRSTPSPTSSEYLPWIHFLIPKILYWVFLSLKVTFTMFK